MGAALWVTAYLAQIAFGMYVHVTYPRRVNLPGRVQNARTYAAWWGFFPIVGIMLILQLAMFAYYRSAIGRIGAQRADLRAELPTSFGSSGSTALPAGETPAGPSRASGTNPFL
jgi:hypothetical protein